MFSYAEEIFALGADLLNALAQRPTHRPMRVVAGIDDVVPKEIAQRLVNPALNLEQPVQLMCREGTTSDTAIRRALDQWLDRHEVRPLIAAEFEDYALLREFARAGRGVAPVPNVLLKQLRQESGLKELGPARKVRGEFCAISMERNIKHPAVLAICQQAEQVFELRP